MTKIYFSRKFISFFEKVRLVPLLLPSLLWCAAHCFLTTIVPSIPSLPSYRPYRYNMWTSLSSLAYHTLGIGEDPIVKDLKAGFARLQKSQKQEADILIKKALQKLQTEEPSAFEEARHSGSGRFIEIIKASAVAMFAGDKVLFEKDIVNAGKKLPGKGFRKESEHGYLQKKCSADGQEVFENAVSVEEFPGVSSSHQTLATRDDSFDCLKGLKLAVWPSKQARRDLLRRCTC